MHDYGKRVGGVRKNFVKETKEDSWQAHARRLPAHPWVFGPFEDNNERHNLKMMQAARDHRNKYSLFGYGRGKKLATPRTS